MQKAPGSHVVVLSHGQDIPDTTKQEAAELAVIYSSAYKAGTGAKMCIRDRRRAARAAEPALAGVAAYADWPDDDIIEL